MGNCVARRRREEDTDYQPDLEDWEDSEEDEDEEQEDGDVEEEGKKERKYEEVRDANSKVGRRNLVSESADRKSDDNQVTCTKIFYLSSVTRSDAADATPDCRATPRRSGMW